jgi:membrane protein
LLKGYCSLENQHFMIKDYLSKDAFKNGFKILKAAFSGFMDDRALKFSASLAYYTIFSLAPLPAFF